MKNTHARSLEQAAQLFENKHLAQFAAEVETARELYRKYPNLVTSPELRPDLQVVLHLAEARGIEAEDVMTDPRWRERVREESRELAVAVGAHGDGRSGRPGEVRASTSGPGSVARRRKSDRLVTCDHLVRWHYLYLYLTLTYFLRLWAATSAA